MINPFLTEIAKDHVPEVEYVAVTELEKKWGRVCACRSKEVYRIFIDPAAMDCPHKALYVLFHEIGHVKLGHLLPRENKPEKDVMERDADRFAYSAMKICFRCWVCMETRSNQCVKEPHE